MPEEIAAIAYQNKDVVYGILFHAAGETLRTIAADPKHLGAEIGFLAVLHTWGQNLLFHPHLHCVVPGGGISPDGKRWIACRPGFFLPVRVLSCLFRRLLVEYLQAAFDQGQLQFFSSLARLRDRNTFAQYLAPLRRAKWVVYAKRPFGGPEQVLNYLGRYTHRVAISNNRLLNIDRDQIAFHWKDYRDHDRQKIMTLSADEFIRRFLLHVLPDGFQRIRHYGFLGHRYRQAKLALCRQLLGVALTLTGVVTRRDKPDYRDLYEKLTGKSQRECPVCHRGQMVAIAVLAASDRAPPFATPCEGQPSIRSVLPLLAFPKPMVRSRLPKKSADDVPPTGRLPDAYATVSSPRRPHPRSRSGLHKAHGFLAPTLPGMRRPSPFRTTDSIPIAPS